MKTEQQLAVDFGGGDEAFGTSGLACPFTKRRCREGVVVLAAQ